MGLFSGIADFFSGGVGSLAGAGLSLIGGLATNSSNRSIAAGNQDFQERMRATQYQTAVKDMEAAGLNPMLAYGQGGAGTPSGTTIPMQNPVPASVTSALDAAQISKVRADTAVSSATAAKILAETPKKALEGKIYDRISDLISPITQSSAKGSMRAEDASKALADIYPDSVPHSPVRQFIDKVGEWNPYGLGY